MDGFLIIFALFELLVDMAFYELSWRAFMKTRKSNTPVFISLLAFLALLSGLFSGVVTLMIFPKNFIHSIFWRKLYLGLAPFVVAILVRKIKTTQLLKTNKKHKEKFSWSDDLIFPILFFFALFLIRFLKAE